METLEVRYISPSRVTAEASRRLLRWLLEQGADELTVVVMAIAGEPAATADAFEDALEPFTLPISRRRVLSASVAAERTRDVRRWTFTPESLTALLEFLPGGIFEHETGPGGWLEDLTIYRGGELVLGVVANEREAVLRLTPAEHEELAVLGIRSTAIGESIEY